jgi:hypothetical protein
MTPTPLFRRFAALTACALLAACSEPASDSKSGVDASAAKMAAPAAPAAGGGRLANEIHKLATTKILLCPAGFFSGTDTFTVASGADTTFNMPGGHALGIPAGAVPTGTQFVVTRAIADTAALDISVIPTTVVPDTVVYLTVNYAACVSPSDTTRKTLFRDEGGHLTIVGTANKNKKVTGALDHFSIYIIGGN